jgi:hypothetical protein
VSLDTPGSAVKTTIILLSLDSSGSEGKCDSGMGEGSSSMGPTCGAAKLTRPTADDFAPRCAQELQVILDDEGLRRRRRRLRGRDSNASEECKAQLR